MKINSRLYLRNEYKTYSVQEILNEIDSLTNIIFFCLNCFYYTDQNIEAIKKILYHFDKKFKTKELSSQINTARLSFANETHMEELLDITPGSVSVMGLMNDHENMVQLLVDEELLTQEYVGCHPCVNTSSLRLKTEDVFGTFLQEVRHDYKMVKLGGKEEGENVTGNQMP